MIPKNQKNKNFETIVMVISFDIEKNSFAKTKAWAISGSKNPKLRAGEKSTVYDS